MFWPKPTFSKNQVNKAGQILIERRPDLERLWWAVEVLNNWRSCHGYPINTFQSTLREKLKLVDPEALVTQGAGHAAPQTNAIHHKQTQAL
jgi:hypothetical protein